jgi:hypothetical protein
MRETLIVAAVCFRAPPLSEIILSAARPLIDVVRPLM